jgi:glycosyltransferase involved in cell wall biosynthesis
LYTRFWEYALQDIIAVLLALHSRSSAARLLVIGAGERGEERQLARLAQRAGVSAYLDQRGWANQSTINAALAAADVALAPFSDTLMNRAKGMAKLLQLLHASVPTIASRVGQATEYIIDGQSGVLVAPDNGGALAQAVLKLLDDADHARTIGANGQQRVLDMFNWARLAATLDDVYATVSLAGTPSNV